MTSERDLVEKVTTVRKISEETIEEKSARNLDEALAREPSIVVRRAGEGVARIDLRGLRTRQILLLVDGVPFYSTEDGNFDPSLIPSNLIERIDVTYSNSSVLYGDGPLAGVLQVRTRSGESGLQARGRGDFREGDQYLGQASVAGAARGFEGFAAGSYISSDGYKLPRRLRRHELRRRWTPQERRPRAGQRLREARLCPGRGGPRRPALRLPARGVRRAVERVRQLHGRLRPEPRATSA